jgi:hypothetical protein
MWRTNTPSRSDPDGASPMAIPNIAVLGCVACEMLHLYDVATLANGRADYYAETRIRYQVSRLKNHAQYRRKFFRKQHNAITRAVK